jgi:hypothetical protein
LFPRAKGIVHFGVRSLRGSAPILAPENLLAIPQLIFATKEESFLAESRTVRQKRNHKRRDACPEPMKVFLFPAAAVII